MAYYRRRWPYRSWRSRSTYGSQVSGRRYFNISFPVESLVTATIPANANYSNVIRTVPYYHPVGPQATEANMAANAAALIGSLAYRSYCRLYDSVKINSVSLIFSIAAPVGTDSLPGLRIYSSWDRCLVYGEDAVTYDKLITGPESQVVTFINNSRCKFQRYNKASDLQERTIFHDCSWKLDSNRYYDAQWYAASGTYVAYNPSISVVLQSSNTTETSRVIPVQIQARYNVTFRNPKFGLSVSDAAAKSDLFSGVKVETVDGSEGVEMGDEEVVEKKKVKVVEPVYEEEVLPDDDDVQEPITQVKST